MPYVRDKGSDITALNPLFKEILLIEFRALLSLAIIVCKKL
ncbi:hypothetical protein B4102_3550 [Heyndrickxia sporothermodurans]|uniref:Uncharacterized protein n=1 Tax=Heyndrickxia sporothermodurans TaxID=46224 RepID=A0A150KNH1_9BACI|nr:hypothetical protein B4102_3550 [Heyndrickxia sporothermodurans]